jgi:Spy/CpxP family protein refolding chaperone
MKLRLLLIALVGLLATSVGISADGHKGHCDKDHLKKMTKHLNLTKDQVASIEKIQEASKPAKEANQEKIQSIRKELDELLQAEPMDKNKIRSKMEEMSKIKIDNKMLWIEDRAQVRAILTPDQKTKQNELMKKHRDKSKKKKDKRKKSRD